MPHADKLVGDPATGLPPCESVRVAVAGTPEALILNVTVPVAVMLMVLVLAVVAAGRPVDPVG
ncbi:MAG: hypothetical protein P8M70_00545, partial [Verrucomicrobiota bacterium]|nr:hypothetical protein [Verrucomicrobiota bacterium]